MQSWLGLYSALTNDKCAFCFFVHVVAEAVKSGVENAGGSVKIFQYVYAIVIITHVRSVLLQISRIPETLPQEILDKMHAPGKPNYPVINVDQLTEFDAFLFGIRE